MKYLCDKCGAALVRSGKCKPLSEVYGPNQIPRKRCDCEKCGKTNESCVTIDEVETCRVATQTNNVEVDDRGLIYLADRANTGIHIIELTGPAKEILSAPASD